MRKLFVSMAVLTAVVVSLSSATCGSDSSDEVVPDFGKTCKCWFYGWVEDEDGNKVPSKETSSIMTYKYEDWHATGASSCWEFGKYWKNYFEKSAINVSSVECHVPSVQY